MKQRNHAHKKPRAGTILTALLLALLAAAPLRAAGPWPILLWPDGAPGAVGDEDRDQPELRVYLPPAERATGTGVVICPGGGYGALATDHEGHQVARWLNSIGVAGFVLKYRLGPRYRHPAPLQDAQRAIRYVRAHAERLHVSPRRIGIMGFSAGGHLASTAATRFDAGHGDARDPVERAGCRPDFVVLAYPVISFTAEFAHRGSARNLLGEDADPQLLASLSNETQVTAETPPAFLFHTGEDPGVPVENSLAFYQACRRAGVPAELHVYQDGPHGVGLAPGDPVVGSWKERLAAWLLTAGLLADVERAAVEGMVLVGDTPLRWGVITFVPREAENRPTAFAIVSRGRYRIPAARGAVVGSCRVEIRDMGAVEPRPTIDDVRALESSGFVVEIKTGDNHFEFRVAP